MTRKVHEGKTTSGVAPDKVFDVTDTSDGDGPQLPPLMLEGEAQERYLRFARAAARLRITGDAHMKAQDEYKQALGLLSASAEKLATGDGQTEPV